MKKIYTIAILLLVLISIVEIVYLTHSDTLASESMSAEKLRNKIAEIDEKNQILQFEILSYSSILIVSSRAAELGFEKPKEFISLKNLDSIALKHE
jgi:hypothetical protein